MATETPASYQSELLSGMREMVRGGGESTPEPTPTPGLEAETAAAPAEEGAPLEATPPDPTPEGNPPPVQSSPASDVSTTSAVEALSKRGLSIADEKTAKEYLRIESELAAIRRAEKAAAKAQPAQPEIQPDRPEPTQATPPALPAPVTTAPPSLPEPQSAEAVAWVEQHVAEDTECQALTAEYHAANAALGEISLVNQRGRLVGGKLFEVETQIANTKRLLEQSGLGKTLGVDLPEMDDITKTELRTRLLDLTAQRIDLREMADRVARKRDGYSAQYHERKGLYFGHLAKVADQRRAEIEHSAKVDSHADAFQKHWTAGKASSFSALNVPVEFQPDIDEVLQEAALAHQGVIPLADLPEFIGTITKRELARLDKYHRLKAAEYGRAKIADAQAATQPTGAVAVAPQAATEHTDWKKRLRAESRARFASR